MDKDIRAALFDGFDEEGEFEELQDDFMLQVRHCADHHRVNHHSHTSILSRS